MSLRRSELSKVIENLEKEAGIKPDLIIQSLEQAILAAAQKKYGHYAHLETAYNSEIGEIEVFRFKKVVESEPEMLDEENEIEINEARKIDPHVTLGDEVGIKIEKEGFGRIDAQNAKYIIAQKVKIAEQEAIYEEYIQHKGEIVSGTARREEERGLIVGLGKTEAFLAFSEMIPGERFEPGESVQAYLLDVVHQVKGLQL